jgi:hypothetical protein
MGTVVEHKVTKVEIDTKGTGKILYEVEHDGL